MPSFSARLIAIVVIVVVLAEIGHATPLKVPHAGAVDASVLRANLRGMTINSKFSQLSAGTGSCDSSPCANGGTCVAVQSSHKCVCRASFFDRDCSIASYDPIFDSAFVRLRVPLRDSLSLSDLKNITTSSVSLATDLPIHSSVTTKQPFQFTVLDHTVHTVMWNDAGNAGPVVRLLYTSEGAEQEAQLFAVNRNATASSFHAVSMKSAVYGLVPFRSLRLYYELYSATFNSTISVSYVLHESTSDLDIIYHSRNIPEASTDLLEAGLYVAMPPMEIMVLSAGPVVTADLPDCGHAIRLSPIYHPSETVWPAMPEAVSTSYQGLDESTNLWGLYLEPYLGELFYHLPNNFVFSFLGHVYNSFKLTRNGQLLLGFSMLSENIYENTGIVSGWVNSAYSVHHARVSINGTAPNRRVFIYAVWSSPSSATQMRLTYELVEAQAAIVIHYHSTPAYTGPEPLGLMATVNSGFNSSTAELIQFPNSNVITNALKASGIQTPFAIRYMRAFTNVCPPGAITPFAFPGQRALCQCPAGYTLSSDAGTCIGDVLCSSSPCFNGGTCVQGVNSFACQCPQGTVGPYCTLAVTACASAPCGGGKCVDENGGLSFSCLCPHNWGGVPCWNMNLSQTIYDPCIRTRPYLNSMSGQRYLGFQCYCDELNNPASCYRQAIPYWSHETDWHPFPDPSATTVETYHKLTQQGCYTFFWCGSNFGYGTVNMTDLGFKSFSTIYAFNDGFLTLTAEGRQFYAASSYRARRGMGPVVVSENQYKVIGGVWKYLYAKNVTLSTFRNSYGQLVGCFHYKVRNYPSPVTDPLNTFHICLTDGTEQIDLIYDDVSDIATGRFVAGVHMPNLNSLDNLLTNLEDAPLNPRFSFNYRHVTYKKDAIEVYRRA